MLKEVPTWKIQDSTKVQSYMDCPRKYLYEYIFGWKSEIPNVHLEFGIAWHLAMEKLLSNGYNPQSMAEAFIAFNDYYRQSFTPAMDEFNGAKTPEVALRAIQLYCEHYKEDNFKVLHVEVSGAIAIAANRAIYFKMDTICHNESGYFSLEHKTGSVFSTTWAAQWRQKMQTGVYSHVLHSLYQPNEVYGVKINGAFLKKEPKLKKDGTPYAGAVDTEFHRIPVRRNLAAMEAWLDEVNFYYSQIEDDFNKLLSSTEEDQVLKAFHRNTENCTKYGLCPFHDYCEHWHNPLRHSEAPPIGFVINHWDPRVQPNIKETMEL